MRTMMSTIFDEAKKKKKEEELSAGNTAWNAQVLTAVDFKGVLARCLYQPS